MTPKEIKERIDSFEDEYEKLQHKYFLEARGNEIVFNSDVRKELITKLLDDVLAGLEMEQLESELEDGATMYVDHRNDIRNQVINEFNNKIKSLRDGLKGDE